MPRWARFGRFSSLHTIRLLRIRTRSSALTPIRRPQSDRGRARGSPSNPTTPMRERHRTAITADDRRIRPLSPPRLDTFPSAERKSPLLPIYIASQPRLSTTVAGGVVPLSDPRPSAVVRPVLSTPWLRVIAGFV